MSHMRCEMDATWLMAVSGGTRLRANYGGAAKPYAYLEAFSRQNLDK